MGLLKRLWKTLTDKEPEASILIDGTKEEPLTAYEKERLRQFCILYPNHYDCRKL